MDAAVVLLFAAEAVVGSVIVVAAVALAWVLASAATPYALDVLADVARKVVVSARQVPRPADLGPHGLLSGGYILQVD